MLHKFGVISLPVTGSVLATSGACIRTRLSAASSESDVSSESILSLLLRVGIRLPVAAARVTWRRLVLACSARNRMLPAAAPLGVGAFCGVIFRSRDAGACFSRPVLSVLSAPGAFGSLAHLGFSSAIARATDLTGAHAPPLPSSSPCGCTYTVDITVGLHVGLHPVGARNSAANSAIY